MAIQNNNNNLNHLINPAFTKVNRLFVQPFARNDEENHRHSLQYYYISNVEIKDVNVLIDRKNDLPANNEEEGLPENY